MKSQSLTCHNRLVAAHKRGLHREGALPLLETNDRIASGERPESPLLQQRYVRPS